MMPRCGYGSALLAALSLLWGESARAEADSTPGRAIHLPETMHARNGITLVLPEITYEPMPPAAGSALERHGAAATRGLGREVDPPRDLIASTRWRYVFRNPSDPGTVLKVYNAESFDPASIAAAMQRDLALQRFLQQEGLPVAAIDSDPRLLRHGVIRQRFVRGRSLERVYPSGYRTGQDPAIDRVLAKVAEHDADVLAIVWKVYGMVFRNTVDCRAERTLGIDLGHCYGNIVLESETGAPVFVDW